MSLNLKIFGVLKIFLQWVACIYLHLWSEFRYQVFFLPTTYVVIDCCCQGRRIGS